MKKIISIILSLSLLLSLFTANLHAQESFAKPYTFDANASVAATTPFGGLISNTLNSEIDKQVKNNGYNIFSIAYEDSVATVDYEALSDCTIILVAYSEDGKTVLKSANKEVSSEDTSVKLNMTITATYFIIKAYLIDSISLKPLSLAFTCSDYTQEMSEFLSKTTLDFSDKKVIKLDRNKTKNNFAVYKDNVITISKALSSKVSYNQANGTYTITYAPNNLKSLNKGDIFAYDYANYTALISKVEQIVVNGTSVVITPAPVEIEDVFSFVKIDTTDDTIVANVTTDSLDENEIEYDEGESTGGDIIIMSARSGLEVEESYVYNYDLTDYTFKDENGSDTSSLGKLNGALGLNLSSGFKFYLTENQKAVSVKYNYKINIDGNISNSAKGNIFLGEYTLSHIEGVVLKLNPVVSLDADKEAFLNLKLNGQLGFTADENGVQSLDSIPKYTSKINVASDTTMGLSLSSTSTIASNKALDATSTINGKFTVEESIFENHNCSNCTVGAVSSDFSTSYNISFINLSTVNGAITNNAGQKINDFYSVEGADTFDLGKCPNTEYALGLYIKDSKNNPIIGADIVINDKYYVNKDGLNTIYLKNGIHTIEIHKSGFEPITKEVTIDGSPKNITISLVNEGQTDENSTPTTNEPSLIPNFIYNYYAFNNTSASNLFATSNIIYVGQAITNSEGELNIDDKISNGNIVIKPFTRLADGTEYLITNDNNAIITGCNDDSPYIPENVGGFSTVAIANTLSVNDITILSDITEIADGVVANGIYTKCNNSTEYLSDYAAQNELSVVVFHDYETQSITAPVGNKDGLKVQKCSICNNTENIALPHLSISGHTAIDDSGLVNIAFKLPSEIFELGRYDNLSVTLDSVDLSLNGKYKYYTLNNTFDKLSESNIHLSFEFADEQHIITKNICSEINDVNKDSSFDILDLIRIKKLISADRDCDINGDGTTNSLDILTSIKLLGELS